MPELRPDPELTLPEAARRLGVHYMTAYRYVRLGRLPASQRDGQWWVTETALESFGRGRGGASRAARSDGRVPPAPHAARLRDRLVAGDEAGGWSVVEAVLAGGTDPPALVLEVLAPALRQVGDDWESGRISTGDEHRATVVATRLVGRLGPVVSRRGRTRGVVLLACVPGNQHALPLALVGLVLRHEGYAVIELGADTPVDAAAQAARNAGDRLLAIGLSVSLDEQERAARATVAAVLAARPDVPVLLGGNAVRSAARARQLGATGWARDAAGLCSWLEEAKP